MAAPGVDGGGLFAEGVRAVLGGWAALQLAVAQGFGGPQSPEKAAWLAGALQEFFAQNAELQEEEVEEFLAEVMDNEFDTAVEDGSLPQVSRQLVTLFARSRRGDAGGVGEALGALARNGPALAATLAAARPGPAPGPAHRTDPAHSAGSAHQSPARPSEGEEESEEEEAMECGTPPPPADGWTLVRGRRR